MNTERTSVLVVEDDAMISHVLCDYFASVGYDCHHVATSASALTVLTAERRDVVIANVLLPDVTGVRLLDEVRRRWSDLPVILITGSVDIIDEANALAAGAFAFLQKPFKLEQIGAAVSRAVSRADTRAGGTKKGGQG